MTATLKCTQCGGDLGEGDGFCAYCGVVALRLPPEGGASLYDDMVDRLRRATAGEFEIGRELGRGGMAAVFLAHEVALDRNVAIKVMSPGLLLGEGMVDRFRHEAITIANLHHPNIVSVYAVRQDEGLHFFVMQYVHGRSLEQLLQQSGRLPLPVVRSILHQVGSALAYAHRRRVIHRDIKPGNILIDGDGNAIVTDFGIAKAAESPTQTATGALVGTPAYMSPEQCRGADVSGASDQYSLGAVAYEMLTGEPPFSGSTFTVLQAHVEREPPPLGERVPHCPPEVAAGILRMLAKDPAARWPRIADAMASLGAEPLADDDPHRLELTRLVAAPVRPAPAPQPHPSAVPRGPAGAVGSVAILPPPADLEAGDTFVLVAMVRGQRGTRLPPGSVTWSADTPGVLNFDPGGGVAVALAEGTTVLTATCQGVRATLPVEVGPSRADDLTIDPPEHGVRAGDEIHVTATARDKRGRLVDRPVSWQTADPGIATVTGPGLLLAQAPGVARITAVLDGARQTIAIPILPARVAALRLGGAPAVVAGGAFDLTATPVDRWGGPLADRPVLWSSSDVRVAVVAAGGRVHALRPGSVVLTASCEGISESLKVNVGVAAVPPAPGTPVPEEPRQTGRRRSRRRRRGRLVAAAVGVGVAGAAFLLFGRPEPVTVAAAPPEPAAYLSYGSPDTLSPVSVAITRRPTRSLRPAGTFQLAAEARNRGGQPLTGAGIAWASSDSAVVRVHPESGRVSAVAPGRAVVLATSGTGRDSVPITVRAASAAAGSLSIAPLEPLRVGEYAAVQATLLNARGSVVTDAALAWSSSDPSVLTVDPRTGQLHAESPGTAVVVARSGPDSAGYEVTVLPPAVAGVIIQGARPLVVGERLTLVAIPTDPAGRALRDRPITWASSDTTVLQVDSASGLVAALAPGTVEVRAVSDGGAGVARVTVFAREASTGSAGAAIPGGTTDAALRGGVDACYGALLTKDADRVTRYYHPVSRTDADNLKKLRRILRTRELLAVVGERVDGEWQIGSTTASLEFGFRLTWRDEAGGRRGTEPVFRAEFVRRSGRWTLASCRIVGTPQLWP